MLGLSAIFVIHLHKCKFYITHEQANGLFWCLIRIIVDTYFNNSLFNIIHTNTLG